MNGFLNFCLAQGGVRLSGLPVGLNPLCSFQRGCRHVCYVFGCWFLLLSNSCNFVARVMKFGFAVVEKKI
jgi:hypothetical protein